MRDFLVSFLALYLFFLGTYFALGLTGVYLSLFFTLSYLLPVLYVRFKK